MPKRTLPQYRQPKRSQLAVTTPPAAQTATTRERHHAKTGSSKRDYSNNTLWLLNCKTQLAGGRANTKSRQDTLYSVACVASNFLYQEQQGRVKLVCELLRESGRVSAACILHGRMDSSTERLVVKSVWEGPWPLLLLRVQLVQAQLEMKF